MKTTAVKKQIQEAVKDASKQAGAQKRRVTIVAKKKVRDAVNHFLQEEDEVEEQKPTFRQMIVQRAKKAAPIVIPLAIGAVAGVLLTRGNTASRLVSLVKMGGKIAAMARVAPDVISATGMRPAVDKALESMAAFMQKKNIPMPKMA